MRSSLVRVSSRQTPTTLRYDVKIDVLLLPGADPGEGRILLSAEREPQNIELRTAECGREVNSWAEKKSLESQFTSSLDIPELFNVAVATKLLQGSRCFLRFIPFAV